MITKTLNFLVTITSTGEIIPGMIIEKSHGEEPYVRIGRPSYPREKMRSFVKRDYEPKEISFSLNNEICTLISFGSFYLYRQTNSFLIGSSRYDENGVFTILVKYLNCEIYGGGASFVKTGNEEEYWIAKLFPGSKIKMWNDDPEEVIIISYEDLYQGLVRKTN